MENTENNSISATANDSKKNDDVVAVILENSENQKLKTNDIDSKINGNEKEKEEIPINGKLKEEEISSSENPVENSLNDGGKLKEENSSNEKPEEILLNENVEETCLSEKEKEYIEMVFALESEKQTLFDESKLKINQVRKELEETQAENERLKKKIAQLEQNLIQKEAMGSKSQNEQYDILTKAKTLLFEKTKVCKQQEQHVAMLKTQVDSIKEVLAVTKDMLNLRNSENEHLQTRLETVDLLFKTEKDRQTLLEKKLEISKLMYEELKKEYDYQAGLHKEIKAAYEQKVKMLDTELKRLNTSKTDTQKR